nr:MAG TPA: hypothetical protein [Caudoviricetes sp.]
MHFFRWILRYFLFPLAGCNFRVFTYCAFYTAPGTIYCATYRPFCQGRGI